MAFEKKPHYRNPRSGSIARFVNLCLQIHRIAGGRMAAYSFIALGCVPC